MVEKLSSALQQFTATVLPSIVRTVVPLVVGWVLSLWLTGVVLSFFGIDAKTASDFMTQWATVLITAVYYTLARLAEKYVGPYFGLFLGWLRQPALYVPDGDNVPVTPSTSVAGVPAVTVKIPAAAEAD